MMYEGRDRAVARIVALFEKNREFYRNAREQPESRQVRRRKLHKALKQRASQQKLQALKERIAGNKKSNG